MIWPINRRPRDRGLLPEHLAVRFRYHLQTSSLHDPIAERLRSDTLQLHPQIVDHIGRALELTYQYWAEHGDFEVFDLHVPAPQSPKFELDAITDVFCLEGGELRPAVERHVASAVKKVLHDTVEWVTDPEHPPSPNW